MREREGEKEEGKRAHLSRQATHLASQLAKHITQSKERERERRSLAALAAIMYAPPPPPPPKPLNEVIVIAPASAPIETWELASMSWQVNWLEKGRNSDRAGGSWQ